MKDCSARHRRFQAASHIDCAGHHSNIGVQLVQSHQRQSRNRHAKDSHRHDTADQIFSSDTRHGKASGRLESFTPVSKAATLAARRPG